MPSEQQRRSALARANRARYSAAGIKRRLTAGEISFGEALLDPAAGSMPVWRLVECQRGWGAVKCDRLALLLARRQVVLPPSKRVGELTDRQRRLLMEAAVKANSQGLLS